MLKKLLPFITIAIFLGILAYLAYTAGQLKETLQRKDTELGQSQAWRENVEKSFINLNKNLGEILGNFNERLTKLEK